MKIIEPSIEILTPLDDSLLKIIEVAGRTCYQSDELIKKGDYIGFVRKIIKNGHEAMLEHASVSIKVTCDRGVTHEIVRHRIAAYAQESTRYCNYSKDKFDNQLTFILPSWIKEGIGEYRPYWEGCVGNHGIDPYPEGSAESWWFWHCAVAERDYLKLLEHGWSPQQARSVLPNSLATRIVMTMNLREWRHFFMLRCAPAAHPQMQEIALKILYEFFLRIPVIVEDIPYTA
jgi:thymidylate synthase (FAD)